MNKIKETDIPDIMKARKDGETLQSIGSRYGVTKERIRQIEAKAWRKIRSDKARESCDNVNLLRVEHWVCPSRVKNCLINLNIYTVEDLMKYSEKDLSVAPNFGSQSMQDLKDYLHKINVKWPAANSPGDDNVAPN